jgi:hypothetical protein
MTFPVAIVYAAIGATVAVMHLRVGQGKPFWVRATMLVMLLFIWPLTLVSVALMHLWPAYGQAVRKRFDQYFED